MTGRANEPQWGICHNSIAIMAFRRHRDKLRGSCPALRSVDGPSVARIPALSRPAQESAAEAKLAQHEVAAALKQPQSFFSRSESGERRVDFLELAAFARLYGKPLEYFVPESDEKHR